MSKKALRQEPGEIHAAAFAVDDEELGTARHAIAAPVRNHTRILCAGKPIDAASTPDRYARTIPPRALPGTSRLHVAHSGKASGEAGWATHRRATRRPGLGCRAGGFTRVCASGSGGEPLDRRRLWGVPPDVCRRAFLAVVAAPLSWAVAISSARAANRTRAIAKPTRTAIVVATRIGNSCVIRRSRSIVALRPRRRTYRSELRPLLADGSGAWRSSGRLPGRAVSRSCPLLAAGSRPR
jgi:hypothetical protein